jgi:hypothetical protein
MAEKQGVPSVPAPKYERGFLTPEQEKKVSLLGLGGVEGIAELLNPYPMNVETGERELAAPGLFEGIASAGKAIAGAIKDPVGTYEKVAPALEQIGDRMMQAPGLVPGQMAFVDGELRPLTSDEVVQERIESGMDPTIALTGAAPIAARTARAGVAGLMPEPGVVSLFGSAERVPERQAAALKLKAEGVSDQKIFEQTGVFYGDDGLLRFEIDDRKAKFKGGFSVDEDGYITFDDIPQNTVLSFIDDATKQKPVTLGDILDHEELYKYYPEAKNIPVRDVPFLSFSEGQFDPIDEVLMVRRSGGKGPTKEAVKELELSLLHELQHYLQYKHDFDTGGAKKQFLPENYDAVRGYVEKEIDSFENILRENGVNPMTSYRLESDMSTIDAIDKRIATQGPLDPEIDKFTIEDYNAAKNRVNSFRYAFDDQKQFEEYLSLIDSQDLLRSIDAEAFNAYKRLSGEVEARQVEFRKDFPTEGEVAAGADDYSKLKPFSATDFIEMERKEVDPRLIGDAIPSPASGNRSQEYYAATNSIKDKFQQALDKAGYSDQKAVDKATRIEGFDYGMDDKSVQKFRTGGIVVAKPPVRGNSGIVDVIKKYRREGMMD